MGEDTEAKEKSHGILAARRLTTNALFSANVSRSYWKRKLFPWWAHQGSNQGPAD
jgi:hypothetical protein